MKELKEVNEPAKPVAVVPRGRWNVAHRSIPSSWKPDAFMANEKAAKKVKLVTEWRR